MGPAHPPTLLRLPGEQPLGRRGNHHRFRGHRRQAEIKLVLGIPGQQPIRLRDQQAKLALITGRADMPHNPPPPGHGLSDLNRRRTRGGPHPTNPRHRRILPSPISALATHSTTTSPQVTALPPSEMARCDPTQEILESLGRLLKRINGAGH